MGTGNSKQYDLEKPGLEKGLVGSYSYKGESVHTLKYESLGANEHLDRQNFHEYTEILEYTNSPIQKTSSKDASTQVENEVEIHNVGSSQEHFDQVEPDKILTPLTEEDRRNEERKTDQLGCSQVLNCIEGEEDQTGGHGVNVNPADTVTLKSQNDPEMHGENINAGEDYLNEKWKCSEISPQCTDSNTEVVDGVCTQNGIQKEDRSKYPDCGQGRYCDGDERTGHLTRLPQEDSTPQDLEDRVQQGEEEDEDPYDTIHSLRSASSDEDVTVRKEVFSTGDTLENRRKDASKSEGPTPFDDSAFSSGTGESSGSGFVCPIHHVLHVYDQGCVDKNRLKYIEYLIEVFRPLLEKRVHVEELLPHLPFLNPDKSRILAKNDVSNKDGIYELLKCIDRNGTAGRWQALLDALDNTDNKHLRNLVDGTTEHDPYYDRKVLQIYTPEVMGQIHLKEFTDHLFQEEVINERDKQRIENIADRKCEIDAIYELLDTIPNRLCNWNDIFLQVLRRLDYSHIADEIEEVTSPTEISKKRKKKKKKKRKNTRKKSNEYTDFKKVSKEKDNGISIKELSCQGINDDTLVKTKHKPSLNDTVLPPLASAEKQKKDFPPPLPRRPPPAKNGIPPLPTQLVGESKEREGPAIVTAHQHQQKLATDSEPPSKPYLPNAGIATTSTVSISCNSELAVGSVRSEHEYLNDNLRNQIMNREAHIAQNFDGNSNSCSGTHSVPGILLGDVFSGPSVQIDHSLEECNGGYLTVSRCNRKRPDDGDPPETEDKVMKKRQKYLDKLEKELRKELSRIEEERRSLGKTVTSSNGCDRRASNDGYDNLWEVEKENSQEIDTGESSVTDQGNTGEIIGVGENPNDSEQVSVAADDKVHFAEEEEVNRTINEETRCTDAGEKRTYTGSDVDLLEIIKVFQQKMTNLESQIVALSSKQEQSSHDPYVKVHSVPKLQPTHVPGYPFPYPMFGWPFFGYPSYPIPPNPAQFFPQSPNVTGHPPNVNTEARTDVNLS